MMQENPAQHHRILAIAPTSRGFGFAVLEGEQTLIDWGIKPVKGDKNAQSRVKVEELIAHYRPDALVLQDASAKGARRSARIQALTKQIVTLAKRHKVRVSLLSKGKVQQAYFGDEPGTKYELAQILAQRFPEELGDRLPPKRRPWTSEDCRMAIFDAVALALTLQLKNARRQS